MDITKLADKFEAFANKNNLGKDSQESTEALWLFCDEVSDAAVVTEDRKVEAALRAELRSRGWAVSDGLIRSPASFAQNIEDLL